MTEPQDLMDGISSELQNALKAMAKTKSPDEKLVYSEIVRNLCDSLAVFFDFAMGPMDTDYDA